jgi:hypothetical protein
MYSLSSSHSLGCMLYININLFLLSHDLRYLMGRKVVFAVLLGFRSPPKPFWIRRVERESFLGARLPEASSPKLDFCHIF